MSKVLVLAVHPDDETLGCGGTLLRHKADGDEIYWTIATSIKEKGGFSKEKIFEVEKEIENVRKMYNFDKVFKLDLPPMKVDELSISEIINKISKMLNEIKPNIVYLPFMGDVHSDHRIIFEAAWSSLKIFRCSFVEKIFMMETPSETEFAPGLKKFIFVPNYFVDISDFLDRKLEIMKVFKTEISDPPFPRSLENIRALATFRGATVNSRYAEAFMLLKEMR